MSKAEEINLAKQQFVKKYPTPKRERDCARYGVNAAVGRAHLYSPNINHQDIRNYWVEQLISIGEKYKEKQTLETFKSDILTLKESMNLKFPGRFNNGISAYDNEFRIAHAQKSLSIFLKHMWCNNLITVLPPVCPIDGIILKYCGSDASWTKVNSIEEYEKHLAIVEGQRKIDKIESLPEWETWAFKRKNSNKKKNVKNRSTESALMAIPDDNINNIRNQFHSINIEQHKWMPGGLKTALSAEISGGWTLAVGSKEFYFCGIYKKVRTDNPYPEIFDEGRTYGYYKRFNAAQEALNQFKDILQKENHQDD